jgi:uncharacterized protein YdaU (DUF1376 family)
MNEPRNGLFVEYCAKDFLDGTNNLDAWEELAYRRLVDLIYSTNDSVKDDNKKLAWATKTGSRWPKIKEALIEAGKIEVVDGRITNARCRKELEKTAKKIEQKRIAGKASAEARKETDKPLKNNETTSTAVGTGVPTADPTAGQLTSNPITQVSKDVAKATSSAPAGAGKKPQAAQHPDFAEWYQQYPKKRDPQDAAKAYAAARKTGASREELLNAAMRYAAECDANRTDPKFIKHPATWLNKGSWHNEPDLITPVTPTNGKHYVGSHSVRTYEQHTITRRSALVDDGFADMDDIRACAH